MSKGTGTINDPDGRIDLWVGGSSKVKLSGIIGSIYIKLAAGAAVIDLSKLEAHKVKINTITGAAKVTVKSNNVNSKNIIGAGSLKVIPIPKEEVKPVTATSIQSSPQYQQVPPQPPKPPKQQKMAHQPVQEKSIPQGYPMPQSYPIPQQQEKPMLPPKPQQKGQPIPQGYPLPHPQQGQPIPQGYPGLHQQGYPIPQQQPQQGYSLPYQQPYQQGQPIPQGYPLQQGLPIPQQPPQQGYSIPLQTNALTQPVASQQQPYGVPQGVDTSYLEYARHLQQSNPTDPAQQQYTNQQSYYPYQPQVPPQQFQGYSHPPQQ